jgi:hypothetical protein
MTGFKLSNFFFLMALYRIHKIRKFSRQPEELSYYPFKKLYELLEAVAKGNTEAGIF